MWELRDLIKTQFFLSKICDHSYETNIIMTDFNAHEILRLELCATVTGLLLDCHDVEITNFEITTIRSPCIANRTIRL